MIAHSIKLTPEQRVMLEKIVDRNKFGITRDTGLMSVLYSGFTIGIFLANYELENLTRMHAGEGIGEPAYEYLRKERVKIAAEYLYRLRNSVIPDDVLLLSSIYEITCQVGLINVQYFTVSERVKSLVKMKESANSIGETQTDASSN